MLDISEEYGKAYVEDGKIFVPLWAIIEKLNGEIYWNDLKKRINIRYNNTEIELQLGKNLYTKNEEIFSMEVFPRAENNRTYVPLEFLIEGLGVKVNYTIGEGKTVLSIEEDSAEQL
ncbi:hypothetical protein M2349_002496 [Caldanaerobacter subterraneus subsp. tengcongensis MB4]|uniref:Copper amine oxidase-like N-terminal domain-containing protein n=1 Tax=Caldanaerobacter subterraneus subsp. tengcongensis (strain DSM 15242 / JCM 11007 / NBRC 100824 / MB4) TaxID=273068 RepID=Q8R6Z1_CALS4|nr:copper amine oxidase N-terminal domain-containing protein [Caldanaerobacter subterraneus]AAM25761.1 conserved hypothetical protein [Caldanaerobacter subterraneus subsp. tengcongensis MB4]MCS3917355.1 hypothetical protein [Caldanaerobacter subterraneus subsp. tengcongensis MB4]